jgi:6-phosphogluconolactonase (cycloisomerase 2 family)
LYVLNAGSISVSGFDIRNDGTLSAKSEASAPLGAGANGGAAIRVSPDGNWLVVTEKGSNTIDVFPVSGTGALGSPVRSGSSGVAPFGFDFVNGDQLVVSEAGSGASSLYDIATGGHLNTESASVSTNGGVATCWLIATTDGRFAFAVNAGSGTISGYRIGVGGMTLLDASGVTGNTGVGSNPLDLDLSSGDRYLYVLENGTGRIGAFAVGPDGALSPLAGIGGLPANSGLQGLAAY